MMYKWKNGSMSQNGKILLRSGDFIPEGLLEADTLERFVKNGSIEVIPEPVLKKSKKAKAEPVEEPKGGPKSRKDEPNIDELM